jgi:hypothetical protein
VKVFPKFKITYFLEEYGWMARKSINFFGLKRPWVYTRGTASRTQKKAVFQSRAMLGRYCNGVGSKNSNDAPRARRDASLNL